MHSPTGPSTINTSVTRRVDRDLIIEPGDERYARASAAFNLTATQRPAAVGIPHTPDDVAELVRYAREHDMTVAPQATGHSAVKLGAIENALLLRTDLLGDLVIDGRARRACVGAGVRWEEVLIATADTGLTALHGTSPDVGVVGYTLGGGLSWYGRRHGVAANHVTAIELVTADGRMRRVDDEHDPALFWALRGGGGAGVGVVTALEFELVPVPELYAGALFFDWTRTGEVLEAWREWVTTVPAGLSSIGRVLQLPPLPALPEPLRGRAFAMVEVAYIGSPAAGERLLAPLRRLGAEIDTVAPVAPDQLTALHMDPREPIAATGDHQLLDGLSCEAISELVEIIGPGSGSPLLTFELRHLGGALRDPHRPGGVLSALDAEFVSFAGALVSDEDALGIDEHFARARHALGRHDTGAGFANFALHATDPAHFYGPAALQRLRDVKRDYDPDALFESTLSAAHV